MEQEYQSTTAPSLSSSLLFQPYRSLGYVASTSARAQLKRLGTERFLSVSLGRSFAVYNLDHLRTVLLSPPLPSNIIALTSHRDLTFVTTSTHFYIFKRQDIVHVIHTPSTIYMLYLFGSYVISVDESQKLCVWDIESLRGIISVQSRVHHLVRGASSDDGWTPLSTLQFAAVSPTTSQPLKITSILHPATYLNKIVIGFSDGSLELWNIKTHNKIYSFNTSQWYTHHPAYKLSTYLGRTIEKDNTSFSVTVLEQSPAVDVIGVGLSNGLIVLLHLARDVLIHCYSHANTTAHITSITFRNDGVPHMSTVANGKTVVWNLDKKQKELEMWEMENTYECYYVQNEPLLLTLCNDNSLRIFLFPSVGNPTLLRSRAGHSQAPRLIQFYPQERGGLTILSAGDDRSLRLFSVERDERSQELSQGSLLSQARSYEVSIESLKLTPIRDMAACNIRDRDFSNVLTVHIGDAAAYTWKTGGKSLDQRKLLNPAATPCEARSVAISACGHYGFVGYVDGRIDMFNMQSGFFRSTYGAQHVTTEEKTFKNIKKKQQTPQEIAATLGHDSVVVGLAVDGLNRILVSACDDGVIKFWDFRKRVVIGTVTLQSHIQKMVYNRENDLVAVVCDDLTVSIIDANSYTIVRRFSGHSAAITSLTFSPDSRWLLTASLDCSVRVFDIPSSRLIDWFSFTRPVTSLSFSPDSAFLCTTHVNNVGLYLWANKDHFTDVFLKASIDEPTEIELPQQGQEQVEIDEKPQINNEEQPQNKKRRLMLSGQAVIEDDTPLDLHTSEVDRFDLITYSSLPKSKWQTLAHLDEIKERNKPKEAPKAPTAAPFFLTSLTSLSNGNDGPLSTAQPEASTPSLGERIVRSSGEAAQSTLISLIAQSKEKLKQEVAAHPDQLPSLSLLNSFSGVTSYLTSLTTSAIDAEVRSLGLLPDTEEQELAAVLQYVLASLESKHHFEFIQAFLNLVLKVHSTTIVKYDSLLQTCDVLSQVQKKIWCKLEVEFNKNISLVAHLANMQL